jgi:hypothetical protein
VTRENMSEWEPADEESRAWLTSIRKWSRRDLYFYGTMTFFWAGLGAWYGWEAVTSGYWWRWLATGIYLGFVVIYALMTRRAWHRWQTCEEILSESPNKD